MKIKNNPPTKTVKNNKKPKQMIKMLEGEKIRLRGLEKEDSEKLHKFINTPEISKPLSNNAPYSKEQMKNLIKNRNESRKKTKDTHSE